MKKLLLPALIVATIFTGAIILNVNAQQQHHQDVKTLWSVDSSSNKPNPAPKNAVVTKNDTIEVHVGDVQSYSYGGYIVRLEPKYEMTDKYLPVVIGDCEASSIQSYKSGTQSTRPMTYDLFTNILMTEQLKIQKVIITKLENNTYYAVVAINNSGKISYVDSRPSDAINLALRSNATVYVMRKVLEDAGEAR